MARATLVTSSPSRLLQPTRPWNLLPRSPAPSDATALQWLPQSLSYIRRPQEAIDEGNRARELDPLSPIIGYAQAESYLFDRQFEKAIGMYEKLGAENPSFAVTHMG